MKLALRIGWLSFMLVVTAGWANAGYTGNNTCGTALPLSAGTHTGFQMHNVWVYHPLSPFANEGDVDWYRFTLQPGQRLTVGVNVTSYTASFSTTYHLNQELYDFDPTWCIGGQHGGTTAENTSPVPRDYVFRTFVFTGGGLHPWVQVNYDLVVQVDTVTPGVSYCPGAPNSVGSGGTLAVSGTNSVSANDLVFNAASLPANGFALLANGTAQSSFPFGDGTLCIGGAISRLQVAPVLGTGSCSIALDLSNLPAGVTIASGDLRYFQLYYRDSFGPLGTGFNLTNAMAVPFTP